MVYYNESYEPMDIDLSKENIRLDQDNMDISYGDYKEDVTTGDSADIRRSLADIVRSCSRSEVADISKGNKVYNTAPDLNTPVIKKYHIVKGKPMKNEHNKSSIILSTVLVLLLSTVTYYIYNMKCSDDLDIKILSKALSHNVFGQSEAMATLVEAFELKEKSKIVFFYGGTGVGKTLVSSLLLNIVGLSSNVYHYTMPRFVDIFSSDVMLGLTLCQSSLIIVDDLTEGDMHIEKQIKEVITKAENLQRNITVILIFNCHDTTKELFRKCDESFHTKLLGNFSGIQAHKSFVKFSPLTVKELSRCIEQEVGSRKLNETELTGIMAHFNVTADGCKGVHSKMKYLNVI